MSAVNFSQFGQNSGYVEELYRLYLNDPGLVEETWANFFKALGSPEPAKKNGHSISTVTVKEIQVHPAPIVTAAADTGLLQAALLLIESYRSEGHLGARINPLEKGAKPLPRPETMEFLKKTVNVPAEIPGLQFGGRTNLKGSELVAALDALYCGTLGFETAHITNREQRLWLQEKIEQRSSQFSAEEKLRQLRQVVDAENFEAELHKKFVGAKRFSVQGGETVLALLDTALNTGSGAGVQEAVFGMAHRGRLAVLAHLLNKPYEEFFTEFEDQTAYSVVGSGDVKYHAGFNSVYSCHNGKNVKVSLLSNPSHLEFVNPVVEGTVRALQDQIYAGNRVSVLPILIHGDAAVIGQGIVTETLNLSRVAGFATGGTLHVVINNQVGFTTDPEDYRSSVYCTEYAKAVGSPVIHVNAEDVEAACWAADVLMQFRNKFGVDVMLDLYCYRRYGHNEGDDPTFTQPLTYAELKEKPLLSEIYSKKLQAQGIAGADTHASLISEFKSRFDAASERRRNQPAPGPACALHGRIRGTTASETAVPEASLKKIAAALTAYPAGFSVHPKLAQILQKRVQSLDEAQSIDWGFAEGLAFGSLILEGRRVRLSGQDVGRGTFSQRHLVLTDHETGNRFSPLAELSAREGGGKIDIYNSTLSEAGAIGFEFGYSSAAENTLVLWEAQFGDFANGGQVMIDQFICSAEQKWAQYANVVLMLPHGYEGQGPEHSSARLERYLQLCADGNMTVAYPSNSAQHFHLLRRHAYTSVKRPLIIMTPKSLLRHPEAACSKKDLSSGSFQNVLVNDFGGSGLAEHVIFTSGKMYYDVSQMLKKEQVRARVIRLEQLYPFPLAEISQALQGVQARTFCWVQEEPMNMGAWNYVEPYFRKRLQLELNYFGRVASASTATGSHKYHGVEQKQILEDLKSQF